MDTHEKIFMINAIVLLFLLLIRWGVPMRFVKMFRPIECSICNEMSTEFIVCRTCMKLVCKTCKYRARSRACFYCRR